MDALALKEKHRQVRESQPEGLRMRIHRALSWLARAERETDDLDGRFIFLWVALNAAYAEEFGFEKVERVKAREFLGKLLACDTTRRLHDVVFRQFTGPIRTLIENKFVFEQFWRALRDHDSSDAWSTQFAAERQLALRALMGNQTDLVLSIVLDRLYVLRNQLVHGGATWNSSANRTQLKDGAAILMAIVPVVIDVMMESSAVDFGSVAYPHISS